MSWKLLLMIFLGASLAIPALVLLWKQVQDPFCWRKYTSILCFLGATVIFMATGRHFYRETALHSHNQAMKARTEKYALAVEEAKKQAALGLSAPQAAESRGKVVFKTCGACHALNHRMVGPPLTEIAQIYAGNPKGIVQWAKAPGKKRPDYPQMIPMTMFSDDDLMETAKYILESVARGSL
jgi:cytochrome c